MLTERQIQVKTYPLAEVINDIHWNY